MSKKLEFEIGADIDGLKKSLNKATTQIDAFGKKTKASFDRIGRSMTNVGKAMSVGVTLPILALGVASVKAASDAEETASKFNTVFRDISESANEAAEELRNSYGLARQESQKLLSDTGDLLTGFGFTQSSALDLASEVNKLAVDLASFTNFSGGAAGASAALTKALLGERESVKSLGISILEADVQARVLENTQKGLTFETERQAKAFATLQIAQDQSKNAIGDYARTNKSFANQVRLVQARVKDLSDEFGKILLPFATKLINKIGDLVKRFSSLDQSTKKTIVVVAALAAAIGPLLLVIGTLFTTVIPGLITAFAALKVAILFLSTTAIPSLVIAFKALTLAISTNPIGALIAALGVGITAFALFSKETEKSARTLSVYEQVTQKATQAIAKEQAELKKLFFIARDENVSKEQRVIAIKKLNAISPKYLGFLNSENINTDKARVAVEKYTKALLENARVKAAEEKLIEVQKRKIENELELSTRRLAVQEAANKLSKLGSDNAQFAAAAETQLANAKNLLQSNTENLNKKLEEEERILLEIIGLGSKVEDTYEKIGDGANKLRRELAKPVNVGLQSEGIASPLPPTSNETGSPDFLAEVSEEAMRLFWLTKDLTESIDALVTSSISNTFANLGTAIGEALATGGNVFSAIGNSLLKSLGNFLSEMGGMLIEYGVLAKAKGALDKAIATGGAVAIGAGIAAIAVGIALKAAGSAIASKANSGLGGGGGLSGASSPDVGNTRINTTVGGGGQDVVFRISGRDLVSVIDRNRSYLDRIGG